MEQHFGLSAKSTAEVPVGDEEESSSALFLLECVVALAADPETRHVQVFGLK